MNYKSQLFLKDFINLIKKCNTTVLNIYQQPFDFEYKKDQTPVTKADLKCNELICSFISKNYLTQDTIIISEENKNIPYQERKNKKFVWLIDPIDGTKEFLKKNGEFTINIALCQDNIPVFGIVSIPDKDEIYYGIKDIGSFSIKNKETSKLIIKDKKIDYNQEQIKIIASSSHINDKTKEYIELFTNYQIINVGSSIKFLYIADNKADLYPRLSPTSEWDTCAAHAVVKYAGGNVINFDSKKELMYNKECLLNPDFLVY